VNNHQWSLEDFVDSLVLELDQVRETLAVKSVNRPLSYAVKDVSLDLQTFPIYEDGAVRFRTAQPGQDGASTIKLQLASITDQQIRATSKKLPSKSDVRLEDVGVDPETETKLRRMGVTSTSDLERLEQKDVDVESAARGGVDYRQLANLIHKARRQRTPPAVRTASIEQSTLGPVLRIEGENLSISPSHVPVAVINDELGEVVDHGPTHLDVLLQPGAFQRPASSVILTLDPYCLVRMQLNTSGEIA
jgi:hypothetical protein